jgi:hypothetical protein
VCSDLGGAAGGSALIGQGKGDPQKGKGHPAANALGGLFKIHLLLRELGYLIFVKITGPSALCPWNFFQFTISETG